MKTKKVSAKASSPVRTKSRAVTKAAKITKPSSRPIKKIRTTPITEIKLEKKVLPVVKNETKKNKSWFCSCGAEAGLCECNFTKVFAGLILVLLGLFYLGKNLGIFPVNIYVNLAILWPLVIVFLGLSMLSQKTLKATLWGVLIAVLITPFVLMLLMVQNMNYYDSPDFRMPIIRHIEKDLTINEVTTTDAVKLDNLVADQLVSSPLSISGEVAGNWFFEGSFPVKVLDDKGNELGTGVAKAEGDWMTINPVKFIVDINFVKTDSVRGMVVFANDNPSGLMELDRKFVVPVMFK